jgi:glycosyltransferase involved in cell wall biosynthesis
MKNLLFYGTTDYGLNLNNSDELKFKELSKNFNAFVITYGNTNVEKKHKDVLIKYLKKPTNLLFQYLKFYFLNYKILSKFIKDKNIDIVSAKDPISALLPILIKKLSNKEIKIVIEHHGDFLNLLLNQRRFYFKNIIKLSTKLISNFTYRNCDIIRGVEIEYTSSLSNKYNKKFICFPAWVDYSIYKDLNIQRKNFLYVGNIIPRKGVMFLIENYGTFSKKYDINEDLIIAGSYPNQEYYDKCKDFIVKNKIENIKFIGEKNPNEISNLMNSSKLLLMASSYEGLPRVLIESGLCGLPSIATNIQGIRKPFGQDGGTLLYELNNSDEFINNIKNFVNNKKLQKTMSLKSFELSKQLAGEGKFLSNWNELEKMIYE